MRKLHKFENENKTLKLNNDSQLGSDDLQVELAMKDSKIDELSDQLVDQDEMRKELEKASL